MSPSAKLLGVVGLVALVLVGLIAANVNPPGCRLFSVDKDEWVAANRELLDDIPVYPGSALMYESSNGWSVAQDRCFALENSGPYDSYATFRRYGMPTGATFSDVAAFNDPQLAARGWTTPTASAGLERTYLRGDAHLTLRSAQGEMFWEFVINHDRT